MQCHIVNNLILKIFKNVVCNHSIDNNSIIFYGLNIKFDKNSFNALNMYISCIISVILYTCVKYDLATLFPCLILLDGLLQIR